MVDSSKHQKHEAQELQEMTTHAEKLKQSQEKKPAIPDDILQQASEALAETPEKPSVLQEKEEQISLLEAEVASLKDGLLRAHADVENIRKRAQRDVEDASKYAVTHFARDLINVLENLHRAEDSIPKDQLETNPLLKNIFDGVEMTRRELLNIFDRQGIKRIDPKGEPYDHNFHQAMMQVDDVTVPENTVVQVLQAGYVIKDRLLRPALVSVSRMPNSNAS